MKISKWAKPNQKSDLPLICIGHFVSKFIGSDWIIINFPFLTPSRNIKFLYRENFDSMRNGTKAPLKSHSSFQISPDYFLYFHWLSRRKIWNYPVKSWGFKNSNATLRRFWLHCNLMRTIVGRETNPWKWLTRLRVNNLQFN